MWFWVQVLDSRTDNLFKKFLKRVIFDQIFIFSRKVFIFLAFFVHFPFVPKSFGPKSLRSHIFATTTMTLSPSMWPDSTWYLKREEIPRMGSLLFKNYWAGVITLPWATGPNSKQPWLSFQHQPAKTQTIWVIIWKFPFPQGFHGPAWGCWRKLHPCIRPATKKRRDWPFANRQVSPLPFVFVFVLSLLSSKQLNSSHPGSTSPPNWTWTTELNRCLSWAWKDLLPGRGGVRPGTEPIFASQINSNSRDRPKCGFRGEACPRWPLLPIWFHSNLLPSQLLPFQFASVPICFHPNCFHFNCFQPNLLLSQFASVSIASIPIASIRIASIPIASSPICFRLNSFEGPMSVTWSLGLLPVWLVFWSWSEA